MELPKEDPNDPRMDRLLKKYWKNRIPAVKISESEVTRLRPLYPNTVYLIVGESRDGTCYRVLPIRRIVGDRGSRPSGSVVSHLTAYHKSFMEPVEFSPSDCDYTQEEWDYLKNLYPSISHYEFSPERARPKGIQ